MKSGKPFNGSAGWDELDRCVRQRDRLLMRCYGAGLALAGACFYLPYRLSQVGATLLVIAFVYMMTRLYAADRAGCGVDAAALWPQGTHPRLALAESVLFYLPFLVGANLVFMGIPLGEDRLLEATWDCAFLFGTALLLACGYCWNMRVLRVLFKVPAFCVGSEAIHPPRSE